VKQELNIISITLSILLLINIFSCRKKKIIEPVEYIRTISIKELKHNSDTFQIKFVKKQPSILFDEFEKNKYFGEFFDLLNYKKTYPDFLTNRISKANKFSQDEIKKYKLFSDKQKNIRFYEVKHQFLKAPYNSIKFLLYIKVENNKKISEILRIFRKKSIEDVVLASKYIKENGIYILDSNFETESTFYQRIQFIDNIKVDNYTEIDSFDFKESDVVMIKYSYNDSLHFKKESIDTFRFFSSYLTSKQFKINGINCYWKYKLTETNEYRMELRNADNGNLLFISADILMYGSDNISLDNTKIESFIDINFDGFKDYIEYRHGLSGSGGSLYIAYVFNPVKEFFEISGELSGGNLRVDTITRSLHSSWSTSASDYSEEIKYFDDYGKIKYTEVIKHESISLDRRIRNYRKIVDNKVVESRIDTINKIE